MKQPTVAIVATLAISAIALGFISLFSFSMFTGWVAYVVDCLISMQIIVGVFWGGKYPEFATRRAQPAKGLLLMATTLLVGFVVAVVLFWTVGGGVNPPAPMLIFYMIAAVLTTFWMTIIWGGWPFTALIKNPVAAGLTLLAGCYVVAYLIVRIFFNYGFMQGAPVYVPRLDPHGMFNAWYPLVFYVTAIAAMFFMLCFDLWPLSKFPSMMKQPVLGVVWTMCVLVLGGIAFYVGVFVLRIDVAAFMVYGPITFIFGSIVVLNMLQGSLFAKLQQPVKGICNVIAVAVIGGTLALVFGALAPVVTGKLAVGPPAYEYEIWLASALLSVTFPLLVFFAVFFELWPLKKAELEG
jgi:hypothetical protein